MISIVCGQYDDGFHQLVDIEFRGSPPRSSTVFRVHDRTKPSSHLKEVCRVLVQRLELIRDHGSDVPRQLRLIVLQRREVGQLRIHVLHQLLEKATPLGRTKGEGEGAQTRRKQVGTLLLFGNLGEIQWQTKEEIVFFVVACAEMCQNHPASRGSRYSFTFPAFFKTADEDFSKEHKRGTGIMPVQDPSRS